MVRFNTPSYEFDLIHMNMTARRCTIGMSPEVTGEVVPRSILVLTHAMPPDTLDAAEPTVDVRLDVDEPTVHVQMVGGATPTADMSSDGRGADRKE